MPCYSPLRAVLVSGPEGNRLAFNLKDGGKAISLPCGRCIGCRLERARQWAVRIMHESKMHTENSFLTLTYKPECLPENGTLVVQDCQLFLKRLRKKLSPLKIRFFLCGEYGERFTRPHYHCIMFGYSFPDKIKYSERNGMMLYESEELNDTWGLGDCRIGDVTFESAAYVSNYATKKITGPKSAEHYQGRKPEFLVMSRRPGIGNSWYQKFSTDVYPSDEVIVRGQTTRPPRYYDQILEKNNPVLLETLKAKRQKMADELEAFTLKGGHVVHVAPSNNARRLAVRELVASAKFAQKTRNLEKQP